MPGNSLRRQRHHRFGFFMVLRCSSRSVEIVPETADGGPGAGEEYAFLPKIAKHLNPTIASSRASCTESPEDFS